MKLSAFSNKVLFVVSMVVLGSAAGAVVWLFLFLIDFFIGLLWHTLPGYFDFAFFPLAVCILGGVVLGLYQRRFGSYPETLDTVLGKVKKTKRYEYRKFGVYSVGALLPIVFGGSVGPEAGLTGIVAGISTWIGDRMKRFGADFEHLTEIGVSAALSAVFTAPLFGFAAPLFGKTGEGAGDEGHGEGEAFVLPRAEKAVVYLCAIGGALAVFVGLVGVTGQGGGLPHFSEMGYGPTELLWTVPLIAAGAAAGWVYHIVDGVAVRINARIGEKRHVLRAVIGGAFLGLCGMAFPYAMFAGETQATELFQAWPTMSAALLFATGLVKLVTTSYCIHAGWRGGHFFPTIFSGISIGLGFAAISGADPVFCMAACTGALVGCLTKQPILTMLLLLLCFPLKGVIVTIIGAAVGAAIPVPKKFSQHLD